MRHSHDWHVATRGMLLSSPHSCSLHLFYSTCLSPSSIVTNEDSTDRRIHSSQHLLRRMHRLREHRKEGTHILKQQGPCLPEIYATNYQVKRQRTVLGQMDNDSDVAEVKERLGLCTNQDPCLQTPASVRAAVPLEVAPSQLINSRRSKQRLRSARLA